MSEQIRLRIDLGAPIIPGEGAAGLCLGQEVARYVDRHGLLFRSECVKPEFMEAKDRRILRSDNVRVWMESGIITQIGIRGGYRGAAIDCLRLGDTVGKVPTELGRVGEDDEDNLVFACVPGMCFEIPTASFATEDLASYSPEWLDRIRESGISEIFVFPPYCDCGGDLRNRPDPTHCPGCGRIVFEAIDL